MPGGLRCVQPVVIKRAKLPNLVTFFFFLLLCYSLVLAGLVRRVDGN